VTVNTPTGGRIPNGAQIEREIPTDFATRPQVLLRLRHPNFDTATNVVEAINRRYGQVATTADGTSVEVVAPANPTERVAFVAKLENLPVEVGDETPKVVFNSRTGTVVISDGLRVKSAAVTHGALKVVISESSAVSQPGPFSKGQTRWCRNRRCRWTRARARCSTGRPAPSCRRSSTWSTASARRPTTSWRSCRRSTRPARSKANWW
jgi:flagellar P-ring protein precursor FlgI